MDNPEKTIEQLSSELYNTWNSAPRNKQLIMVQLFAMRNHNEILKHGIGKIVSLANVPKGYIAEISKAINLMDYVELI